jgi:hypothetical protein
MSRRHISFAICLSILFLPRPATAQVPVEVTLTVPVRLKFLSPDISKLGLRCSIRSDAITNGNQSRNEMSIDLEVAVFSGQAYVNQMMSFYFTDLDSPAGKLAHVTCTIQGWSVAEQRWGHFTEDHSSPAFWTNITLPDRGTTFTW